MNIKDFIQHAKITHVANAYNYHDPRAISSVHFFSKDGLERGYIVPMIYGYTKEVVEVNRENPIDSKNKQPINKTQYINC